MNIDTMTTDAGMEECFSLGETINIFVYLIFETVAGLVTSIFLNKRY